MLDYSNHGDNLIYESMRSKGLLDWYLQDLRDYPRRTIQITGGAQFREAREYAIKIKRETPTQRVIIRKAVDDNIHKKLSHQEQLDFLLSLSHNQDLIVSWENEPDTSETSLRDCRLALEYLLPRLRDRGIQSVVMNLSTGAVNNIESRVPVDLIKIGQMTVDYNVFFGWHDYLNTQFWPGNTYLARYRYLMNHVPDLSVIITEFGFDSHDPNPQLNGWKTHIEKWRELFPGVNPEQVYWNELVKGEAYYAVDDVDPLHYSLGSDPTRGERVGAPFDYSSAITIQRLKNTYRRSSKMQETKLVLSMPVNYRNIRTSINATSPESDIGDIRVGDVITLEETGVTDWYHIISPIEGYAWLKDVKLGSTEVEENGLYVKLPESRFRDGKTALEFVAMLRAYADAIEDQVKNEE